MPQEPLYPVDGHPLLEADALALDAGSLREQTLVAERRLGLRGADSVVFTGDQADEAARYVAMQVSLQAAADPEVFLAQRVSRGSEDIMYNAGGPVHPWAKEGVDALYADLAATEEEPTEDAWPITGGYRTGSGTGTWPAVAEQNEAAAKAQRNRGLG